MLDLSEAQARAGDADASVSTLEGWSKIHPEDFDVNFRLASVYMTLGRKEGATKVFEELLRQQPQDPAAMNNLAWLLREDESDKALEYAERALAAAPESPGVMDTLGVILLKRGDVQRAVELLHNAADRARSQRQIHYHFAQALVRNGDNDQARTVLIKLLQQEGSFAEEEAAKKLLASLNGLKNPSAKRVDLD